MVRVHGFQCKCFSMHAYVRIRQEVFLVVTKNYRQSFISRGIFCAVVEFGISD